MPGKPHLEVKVFQCFKDVGGADAWVGPYWDGNSQWWTGWHQPGPAGLAGLNAWSWPNDNWVLIGYERWTYSKKYPHERLIEAYYQDPNPSTLAADAERAPPAGHWHMVYDRHGRLQSSTWDQEHLVEPRNQYLKGQGPADKGKGKGKGPADKGKGKGLVDDKGKGKSKGKVLGKKGKKGKKGKNKP